MAQWKCEKCGTAFKRDAQGSRYARFCSQRCYHAWRKEAGVTIGQFKPGLVPWNKGVKGSIKPNRGSFKKGIVPASKREIGDIAIRRDKSGKLRAWVKVSANGNPYDWKLRAVVVWEKENGLLASGLLIHHKDRDTLNDAIANLESLTRSQHLKEHRHEYDGKRKIAAAEAVRGRHAAARVALQSNS